MNLELLNRVWKQIDSQPETWKQSIWFHNNISCGTQACVAGWAALLSGWEPNPADRYEEEVVKNGDPVECSEAARQELGLTREQSLWLFDSGRTYDDIKSFVNEANKEEA